MPPPLGKLIYNRPVSEFVNQLYDLKLASLKNYIFVATTGRSGTLSLVDIFQQLDSCVALHEPYPAMHDEILTAAAMGDDKLVENFYFIRKSVNIRRAAVGARHYIEANHLFVKTFIKYAAEDFGNRLRIIHLVRNPTSVANSIYTLQDQPGTEEGNRWWLDYRAPTNLIQIADTLENNKDFSHPYYKALWYWFEIEARIAMWKNRLPHIPFIFFKTESFNDINLLTQLMKQLDIDTPPGFVQHVVNMKSHGRDFQKKLPPLPNETTSRMLEQFTTLMVEKRFAIPDTLNEYQ